MQKVTNLFVFLLLSCSLCFAASVFADEKSDLTYSNVNNEELQKMIDDGVLVIDIRREEEWKQTGIIAGSKTITFFDRAGRISPDFLPKFTAVAKKDQAVVLICRSGARTKVASQAIAQQLGYKKVVNVTNGIMSWITEKRPISVYAK